VTGLDAHGVTSLWKLQHQSCTDHAPRQSGLTEFYANQLLGCLSILY
jgi:hypothetical protein